MGKSNVSNHSGFRFLLIEGVDCLLSPSVTTRYYIRVSKILLRVKDAGVRDRWCLPYLWQRDCVPDQSVRDLVKPEMVGWLP